MELDAWLPRLDRALGSPEHFLGVLVHEFGDEEARLLHDHAEDEQLEEFEFGRLVSKRQRVMLLGGRTLPSVTLHFLVGGKHLFVTAGLASAVELDLFAGQLGVPLLGLNLISEARFRRLLCLVLWGRTDLE